MKKNVWIFGLLFLAVSCLWYLLLGCSTLPTPAPASSVVVTPSPTPAPELTVDQSPADPPSLSLIKDLASKSACAAYSWKNRGHAPKSYVQGVALVYVRAVCNSDQPIPHLLSLPPKGDMVGDALAWYGVKSDDYLTQTYALLIGLGMRESSGKHCCGRDMSANFSSADSAEAGAFQASWGARRVSPELTNLFAVYSGAKPPKCFLDVFKQGVSCSSGDAKNWGTGQGQAYQALAKTCPAFATEYASLLVRLLGGTKGEFGPFRTKAAELRPECVSMLSQVKQLVQKNPELCGLL